MKFRILGIAMLTGLVGLAMTAMAAETQDFSEPNPWSFGSEAGVQARTVGGTAFIVSGHAERRLSGSLSAGIIAFASSAPGLTEYAGALTGGYRMNLGGIPFTPFAGVGALRAHYETDKTSGLYIPVGVRGEYRLGNSTFTGTVMVNIHQLDFDILPGHDKGSVAVMLGFKI